MNNSHIVASITLILFFIVGMPAQKASAQYDDAYVSYNDFYQNLAPYGQWIDDPKYGYVWAPNVDGNFRPYYTSGHWVMTDYGNTWVSDLPWGWACFHYGRWTFDNYYGWLWIPGSEWGPAWVSWRETENYYGWAPLGPDYAISGTMEDYYCPNDWWVFIPPQYIYTGNYYHYWYGPRGNSTIIRNSRYIRNTYQNNHVTYVSGPNVRQVEKTTHQPVQVYKLNSSTNLTTRVHGNTIRMYRPTEIRPVTTINGSRVRPPNVVAAPQPVNKPQSTNGRTSSTPEYRNDIPTPVPRNAVGTNVAEPVKAAPRPRNTTNPYEYDVNRQQTQPAPGERVPQQQVQPIQPQQPMQPQRPLSRPQAPVMRNEPARQQPAAPQRAMPMPTPAPQAPRPIAPNPMPQARPVPQQATAPARPAPAQSTQQRESSGRR